MTHVRIACSQSVTRIWWRYRILRCGGPCRIRCGFHRHLSMSNNKVFDLSVINPAILDIQYAVRGPIVVRAAQIEHELLTGVSKPFKKVIRANIGDCHAVGQVPITFLRQVLSACTYPQLMEKENIFPADVVSRAKTLLSAFRQSIGCYTDSIGCKHVRNSVSTYISERDGYPCDPDNIFLSNGASAALKTILYTLMSGNEVRSGIMVPVPQYPLYSATLAELSGEMINYYLDEEKGWQLNIKECQRALEESRKRCNPKAMVVINPGNPTGQVLSYQNMMDIVHFCKQNKLVLLADEVYQHNIYDPDLSFFSFKKVVRDCGYTEDNFELISFNSISKGYAGECGIRGGYMELFGIDPKVRLELVKLVSVQLCSSSSGQVLVDCIMRPPISGDPSYPLFHAEKTKVLNELAIKAEKVQKGLASIPGITCNRVQGAMYAFPRLHLPPSVIEAAKKANLQPDEYYCFSLLEETGVCVVPGTGFSQQPSTHHFRLTILPSVSEVQLILDLLKNFHMNFINKHS